MEAVYLRSRTAWEDDLLGTDLSSVALGTVVLVVEEGMVEWSSVQNP